jgi:indolepyruvate ferredoxin oxidoreductase alpha subunit
MKLVERELGQHHVSCDIGCHLFSILPPFNIGATTMGYGLGWAGAAAFKTLETGKRTISIMGDGGFWHNGLTSGVGNAVFNQSDSVLLVVDNGYSAATGGQDLLSSHATNPIRTTKLPIADAVRGVGVRWVREIKRTYDVARMRDTLTRSADDERERSESHRRPERVRSQSRAPRKAAAKQKMAREGPARGSRAIRCRRGYLHRRPFLHSPFRLSFADDQVNPDPLRKDPVATVIDSCIGCGLCGEVADAAVLCPSFYKTEVISNPTTLGSRRRTGCGAR